MYVHVLVYTALWPGTQSCRSNRQWENTKDIKSQEQRAADTCYQNPDPMAPTATIQPLLACRTRLLSHWQTGAHKKHSHQWTVEPFPLDPSPDRNPLTPNSCSANLYHKHISGHWVWKSYQFQDTALIYICGGARMGICSVGNTANICWECRVNGSAPETTLLPQLSLGNSREDWSLPVWSLSSLQLFFFFF